MMRLHPITMIFLLFLLFFMVLIYNNPLYILSILFFLMILIHIAKKNEKLIGMIKYCIYNAVIIAAINSIVSGDGKTVLFQSSRIPLVGRITITGEALAYGTNMGLKLFCIVLIFALYGLMTDKDDTFSFFSKYAHKLTITFSMTLNMIHRLKIEALRVKEVMEMRGVRFSEKKLIRRIKAYYPLLKVIFISALEGSLDRAEALHSRGYGNPKRSAYVHLKMSYIDYFLWIISAILSLFLLWGLTVNAGSYEFYPDLQRLYLSDFFPLAILDFIFILTLFYLVRGRKQWKFLK